MHVPLIVTIYRKFIKADTGDNPDVSGPPAPLPSLSMVSEGLLMF